MVAALDPGVRLQHASSGQDERFGGLSRRQLRNRTFPRISGQLLSGGYHYNFEFLRQRGSARRPAKKRAKALCPHTKQLISQHPIQIDLAGFGTSNEAMKLKPGTDPVTQKAFERRFTGQQNALHTGNMFVSTA